MTSSRGFPAAWGLPGLVPKPCDCCNSAAALLFCRTDSTFLCVPCDAKMHAATKLGGGGRHERVWMCEVCEQAPAVVTCKADAAVLCFSCDSDIHSANPLSRRHERVPVVPFYDTAESVVKSTEASLLAPPVAAAAVDCVDFVSDVSAGWITSDQKAQADVKSMELVFSEPDCFMEFDYPVPNHYSSGADGVVPVQAAFKQQFLNSEKHFEIDFSKSNVTSYNHSYTAPSLSQSVSSSSMEVGVVPDGNSLSEISYSIGGGAASSAASGVQAPGLDREARVLRYREKRKNRKFEKTIRYASRKAYAETRPRIKGRFAKRTETVDSDDVFCPTTTANFFPESRYGVVPSFC